MGGGGGAKGAAGPRRGLGSPTGWRRERATRATHDAPSRGARGPPTAAWAGAPPDAVADWAAARRRPTGEETVAGKERKHATGGAERDAGKEPGGTTRVPKDVVPRPSTGPAQSAPTAPPVDGQPAGQVGHPPEAERRLGRLGVVSAAATAATAAPAPTPAAAAAAAASATVTTGGRVPAAGAEAPSRVGTPLALGPAVPVGIVLQPRAVAVTAPATGPPRRGWAVGPRLAVPAGSGGATKVAGGGGEPGRGRSLEKAPSCGVEVARPGGGENGVLHRMGVVGPQALLLQRLVAGGEHGVDLVEVGAGDRERFDSSVEGEPVREFPSWKAREPSGNRRWNSASSAKG